MGCFGLDNQTGFLNSARAGLFMSFLASQLSNHQEAVGDSVFILPLIPSFFKVHHCVPSTVRNNKVISQKRKDGKLGSNPLSWNKGCRGHIYKGLGNREKEVISGTWEDAKAEK